VSISVAIVAILPRGSALARRLLAILLLAVPLLGAGTTSSTAGAQFSWESPPLEDPTTITLDAGPTYTLLDSDKDYIIRLPGEMKLGRTMIEGGRNVVIRGGHITVPPGGASDTERRGLYIKNATGIVHIEGVLIDGLDSMGFDAIAISAPEAIVQIVNVRVEGVTGQFDGFHGDIVQPFGGVQELRIDHLSGTSNYQGLYLTETSGPIGAAIIRNVNLSYEPNAYDPTTYLLWLPVERQTCEVPYPVALQNVYVSPRPGQDAVEHAVWPNSWQPADCTAAQEGQEIMWPSLPGIAGEVTEGEPPQGDFVPVGTVGPHYARPALPSRIVGGSGRVTSFPSRALAVRSRLGPAPCAVPCAPAVRTPLG